MKNSILKRLNLLGPSKSLLTSVDGDILKLGDLNAVAELLRTVLSQEVYLPSKDGSNVRVRCSVGFILPILLLLPLVPVASAESSSGFAYSGGLVSPSGAELSSVVAWSNDGELLATSYHYDVVITTVESRRMLVTLNPSDVVRSLAFTDDDSHLIVGLDSPYQSTLAVGVYETSGWSRVMFTEEGRDVDSISIVPGGLVFAVANDADGVIEYEISSGNVLNRFDAGHSERVTCISHSPNGQLLLTGGGDGAVNVWDRGSSSIVKTWNSDDAISDCSISPNGEWIVWTSGTLMQVRQVSDYSLVTTVHLGADSKSLEWGPDSSKIWLLTEVASPRIVMYATSSWTLVSTIELGHKATDFSVEPNQRQIAVPSNGKVVALYSMDRWPSGFGVSGSDLDEDGISNSRDSDDDGDGVPDEYDNICDSGVNCASIPDVDLIRTISITANGARLLVSDNVQLNLTQSNRLRELAAHSIHDDSQVDNGEASRMERMLCQNMDEQQILTAWVNVLTVDEAVVLGGQVSCNGKVGLIGTGTIDTQTRIEVRWTVELTLSNALSKPYNLSYDLGIPSPTGTVAMAAPQWPVRFLFYHEGILEYDSGAVSKSSPESVLYVEADPPRDANVLDLIIEWLTANPGPVAGTFVVLVTILLVIVRLRNRVDFEYESIDEEFDEYGDDEELPQSSSIDEYPEYGADEFKQSIPESTNTISAAAARGPPPARIVRQQPDRPPPDKRRTRKVVKPEAVESVGEYEEAEDEGPPDVVDVEESDPSMRIAAELAAESPMDEGEEGRSWDSKSIENALSMITSKPPVVQPPLEPVPDSDDTTDEEPAPASKKRRRPVRRRKK